MKLAVSPLEEHPDRIRIHKLLYFVYSQQWVSDLKVLDQVSIHQILQNLLIETPSLDQLQGRLLNKAEKLNKPDKYIQLANAIMETLRKGKGEPQDSTPQPDRFKMRFALMQVMIPYKAKAVLIALHQKKSQGKSERLYCDDSLDTLLSKVLQYYPSQQALARGLASIQRLPYGILKEETEQLTQTLLEAMRPYLNEKQDRAINLEVAPPIVEELDLSSDIDAMCTLLISPDQLPSVIGQRTSL